MRTESIQEENRLMYKLRPLLFAERENKCVYCGATENLSHDHIVATSEGGKSEMSNLQILCMPCNRKKGGKKKARKLSKHTGE